MVNAVAENPDIKSVLTGLCLIVQDLGYSVRLIQSDIRTLQTRSSNEGLAFLTKTLPALGKAFDRALGIGVFKLPPSFSRKWRDSEIPSFLGSLFTLIFDRDGTLRKDACASAVKSVRQVCFFAYKAITPYRDEDVDRILEGFITVDSTLPATEYKLGDSVVLDQARRLTTDVFGDYTGMALRPKHGPGVVSNIPRSRKFTYVPPYSQCVRHFGTDFFGFREKELRCYNAALFLFSFFSVFVGSTCFPAFLARNQAKVITVPKDSRGPRIISCEPAEHQFVQQGILIWTVSTLERHFVSSGSVNFTDQGVNRGLVKRHSLTQSYSTLDLKEASDRVSLAIVKYLFGDSHSYLEDLLACRSTSTSIKKTDGSIVELHLRKFAPMGSAVCFSTLAWVIYALIYSDLFLRGYSNTEIKDGLYVYGDDVVIRTEWVRYAVESLENHSLLVNKEKSFVNSRFLESCGLDAFDGVEVQPVRFKACLPAVKHGSKRVFRISDQRRAEAVVKTVELANGLKSKGYHSAAEYYYSLAEYHIGSRLPYGIISSPYLNRNLSSYQDAWVANSERRSGRGPCINAFVKRPVRGEIHDTEYGRLRRVLPMMGQELNIPAQGECTLPKSYTLECVRLHRFCDTAYAYLGKKVIS